MQTAAQLRLVQGLGTTLGQSLLHVGKQKQFFTLSLLLVTLVLASSWYNFKEIQSYLILHAAAAELFLCLN